MNPLPQLVCSDPPSPPAGRCPLCYECPCCASVLSPAPVSLEEAVAVASASSRAERSFCLQCLYCQWTSEDAGVVAPDPATLAEVAAAEAAREKEGGGGSGNTSSASIIDALLKAAKHMEATAANARGGGGGARLRAGSGVAGAAGGGTASLLSAASGAGAVTTGPWKVRTHWRGK